MCKKRFTALVLAMTLSISWTLAALALGPVQPEGELLSEQVESGNSVPTQLEEEADGAETPQEPAEGPIPSKNDLTAESGSGEEGTKENQTEAEPALEKTSMDTAAPDAEETNAGVMLTAYPGGGGFAGGEDYIGTVDYNGDDVDSAKAIIELVRAKFGDKMAQEMEYFILATSVSGKTASKFAPITGKNEMVEFKYYNSGPWTDVVDDGARPQSGINASGCNAYAQYVSLAVYGTKAYNAKCWLLEADTPEDERQISPEKGKTSLN